MKIGILTFHDGINYGAFFQVSALHRFLVRAAHDCQVINYKNKGFAKRELCGLFNIRHPVRSLRNLRKMLKFKRAHRDLNMTKRVCTRDGLADLSFDRVVIGSDEVWNYGTNYIGYDPVYFSEGLNAKKIISYAASFGSITPKQGVPDELVKLLDKFSAISVRDGNSAEVISDIGSNAVERVLDPVFLTDFQSDAIRPPKKDYLLVYGYSFTEKMKTRILEYAATAGLRTVSAGYRHEWCDESVDAIGPYEWLGYMLNSACVVTTMFHGFVFSLVSNKNFCMFKTPYRANKLGTLPQELGVEDRVIVEDQSVEEVFRREIDYDRVNTLIDERKRASISFLLKAIG